MSSNNPPKSPHTEGLDELYDWLEGSFAAFQRADPQSGTTASATIAADYAMKRFEALLAETKKPPKELSRRVETTSIIPNIDEALESILKYFYDDIAGTGFDDDGLDLEVHGMELSEAKAKLTSVIESTVLSVIGEDDDSSKGLVEAQAWKQFRNQLRDEQRSKLGRLLK